MTVGVVVRPGKRGPDTVQSESEFKDQFNLDTFSGAINADGGQIKFPATQNPSANANTLDDYEEGTWTPELSDGTNTDATHVTQSGNYTKIGNIVFIAADIEISSLGSLSGGLQINGLPFTASAPETGGISVDFASGLNITAGQIVTGQAVDSTTQINLRLWDNTAGVTQFLSSEMSADGRLIFHGFYFV